MRSELGKALVSQDFSGVREVALNSVCKAVTLAHKYLHGIARNTWMSIHGNA